MAWRDWPTGFRLASLAVGAFTIGMSLIPTLVYVGMAPVIQSNVLLRFILWRSGPILLAYVIALIAAVILGPLKRPLTGAALLTASMPIAVALAVYGLR